jgi:TolB-like protein
MASIIPGYDYDIFISYRQKDNKYDGWVTEFADNLKKELEATFKEEISVYFDINPHDGLLETHDVDDSLKEKLKCLVFIPVISRTYCDQKSFAWEHEFKKFIEQAFKDQFGLKVKLPNGNVASRVLPIRIHDLDDADIKMFEEVTGSKMRTSDFMFSTTSGVNRPLKAEEDHPYDNLNKTYYRDQINKVALAIKEIIAALKNESQHIEKLSKRDLEVKSVPKRNLRTKIIIGLVILLSLIIVGLFIVPKLIKPSETLEKSIAVLPFVNLSNEPEQEYFSEGVVEAILNHLFKVGDLKVISSTSSKRYKNSKLSMKEIARELGVSSILEGSVQKIGNNVRITTQLIDAKTDTHLWSEIYDKDISDIFVIQSEVAQNVAMELKAKLTSREKEQIKKNYTSDTEAYNLYLQGRYFWYRRTKEDLQRSVDYFEKAISIDPNYALAYAGLADAYFIQAFWGWLPWDEGTTRSKELTITALDIDKNLAEAHTVLGAILNYKEWKWEEAQKELQLALKLNPKFVTAHHYYSELLDILGENDKARTHINIALELDPFLPVLHALSSGYYYREGKFKESLDECFVLQELEPEYYNRTLYWRKFYIYTKQKEDLKAIESLQKALYFDTSNIENSNFIREIYGKDGMNGLLKWLIERELKNSQPSYLTLARIFNMLGNKDAVLDCLEKAFENPPPGIARINNDPDFDNIRSEPRFQAIIMRMELSKYQIPK